MWRQLFFELQNLNIYIVIMLALTVAGMVILLEKIITLTISQRLHYSVFVAKLKVMLRAKDWESALRFCDSHEKNALATLSSKAIESFLENPNNAQSTIEEEAASFIPQIESRLSILPALATSIMLIGILATVHGLWDVIYTAQETGGAGGINLLELGLSRCLAPTAFGLFACIILFLGNYFCVSIAERILNYLQQVSILLKNHLVSGAPAAVLKVAPVAPIHDKAIFKDKEKDQHEEEVI